MNAVRPRPSWATAAAFAAMLFLMLAPASCGTDDDPESATTSTGASLTSSEAIRIIQSHLEVASMPITESRSVTRSTRCSQAQADVDPQCKPCHVGSSDLCRNETIVEKIERAGRCPFPPSKEAEWTAEYVEARGVWEVQSVEGSTGKNRWTVDDGSAEILSGYCYP